MPHVITKAMEKATGGRMGKERAAKDGLRSGMTGAKAAGAANEKGCVASNNNKTGIL